MLAGVVHVLPPSVDSVCSVSPKFAAFSLRTWQTIRPSAASTACSSWYFAGESPARAGIGASHRQVCPSSADSETPTRPPSRQRSLPA